MWRFVEGDLAAVLRVRVFRLYSISRVTAGIGQSMLQAIIAWQVYALSGSALDLGLVGLVRFVPALSLSLVSGVVVDTYDRRRILLIAQAVPVVTSLVMLAAIATGQATLLLVYGLVFIAGVTSAFEGPSRQSLLPSLVPRNLFARAMTLNSTLQSLSALSGPAVAGALIAWQGIGLSYAAHCCLVLVSLLVLLPVRIATTSKVGRSGMRLEAVREGLAYLRHRPVVVGAMTLDMFAVLFGGAKALLPIYAVDILHADAAGYGLLTASLDAGALLAAALMVALPTPTHLGRALLASVAAFGLATIAFGLSRWLPLSILTYAAVGAADQVSVVMRLNTIQLTIPDELRGRVTAVNFVFINASNQIGGLESGVVASLTSAMFAVVSGGVACLGVVGLVAWRIPELRNHQSQPRLP
ncbi:MAG TPA: MFS transporter [Chloroflexota bacterium]|nr:MFS transporter [Chloroflexota bacterium]